jgi:hypothetical protein
MLCVSCLHGAPALLADKKAVFLSQWTPPTAEATQCLDRQAKLSPLPDTNKTQVTLS